jgi:hypothetical protein
VAQPDSGAIAAGRTIAEPIRTGPSSTTSVGLGRPSPRRPLRAACSTDAVTTFEVVIRTMRSDTGTPRSTALAAWSPATVASAITAPP